MDKPNLLTRWSKYRWKKFKWIAADRGLSGADRAIHLTTKIIYFVILRLKNKQDENNIFCNIYL